MWVDRALHIRWLVQMDPVISDYSVDGRLSGLNVWMDGNGIAFSCIFNQVYRLKSLLYLVPRILLAAKT